MKLLIVTPLFPPEIGGPATYAPELAKRLIARGHEVKVITLAEKHPSEKYSLEVFSVLKHKSLPERELRLLKAILEKGSWADAIYALDIAAIGLQCVLAGKLLRKPVIVRYAGDTAWEKAMREGKTSKLLEEFLREPDANHNILKIQRFVLSHCRLITTPSNYLKRVVAERYKVPWKKIIAIPNAVEIGRKALAAGKRRAEHSRFQTILTVCRLVPWKGVSNLIAAMPAVLKKFPAARLEIVGDGPQRAELERLAGRLGIAENTFFLGRLSREKTLEHMAACDVFVLNSLYEGMAHVLLEAGALGARIVASDIEPNKELQPLLKAELVPTDSGNITALSKSIIPLLSKPAKHSLRNEILKAHSWGRNAFEFERKVLKAL